MTKVADAAPTGTAGDGRGNQNRVARALFGRRKGHKLRKRQADLFDTLLPRLAVDLSQAAPAELSALFAAPVIDVELEIGFGSGESLIGQAAARPSTGFIGVEPFANGMAKALSSIEDSGLQNIRLHFDDAANLLDWLPSGSLRRIDMIYPDPWPKRRHWKRRLIQDARVVELARVLRIGGELRFVTDVADYAAWTLLRLLRSADLKWTAQIADDWRNAWPDFVPTRYHAKAARGERAPTFLIFRRT